ncbi:MAG: outer membrane beta-barrel protein [Gammaproteobacteria bacterium]|jgi:hypothetical protein|nr:outer membrane beta-barrel protein [Gammaproteobacteria bacterium]MBT3723410.1 outer membrane beta-barrel protein [Gammaproteobacteria bacterium]MBT4077651.1 outer membrane beta-barrel protein [Gammaproteobacteria bacterium]MBT4196344.1 outer membrane beta-barrel protein [Gammaproteobacteria bacterium]MBT4452394.1 outer membrane beta-barrel protein [Gammaproteobacteria bacterium]
MNKKLLSSISIVALSSVLSGFLSTSYADNFDYNYIEGAYQDIDLNGQDSDAFGLSGSYDINTHFNIMADFSSGDISAFSDEGDSGFDEITIGMGYHTAINSATDLTANIKLLDQSNDLSGDDTGYGLGIGVRHMLSDKIEVGSNIDFMDIYDTEDTVIKVNSRYYFNDKASMSFSFGTSSEDVDTLSTGLRFNF